jgi:uncharacterized membrane protein YdfJ with MMPL/SSD domain
LVGRNKIRILLKVAVVVVIVVVVVVVVVSYCLVGGNISMHQKRMHPSNIPSSDGVLYLSRYYMSQMEQFIPNLKQLVLTQQLSSYFIIDQPLHAED